MEIATTNHATLVNKMARGDQFAAAQLYDELSAVMYALALRIVGVQSDAEEVVLDAFTKAWTSAAKYEVDCTSVLTWLAVITRMRALEFVGKRRRPRSSDSRVHDSARMKSRGDNLLSNIPRAFQLVLRNPPST